MMKRNESFRQNFCLVIVSSVLIILGLGANGIPGRLPLLPLLTVLAAFIFLVALIKTEFALIILIFSMLLSPEFDIGGIPGRAVVLRLDDIFLIVIFFGWLAKMAVYKELGLLKTNPLNKPILAYIGICIFSTLLGALRGDVKIQQGVLYLLKYIEYFLLFFMVVNNLRDIKQAKRFLYFMLFVAAIVSLYAFTQIGTGVRVSAPFEGEGGEANTLAGYLLLMMGIVIGLALYPSSRKQQFILLLLLGLMGVPFLFTLSRGAWFGFIIMFISFMIINKKSRLYLFFVLVIFILFSSRIIPHQARERVRATFVGSKTYSILGRNFTFDESSSARIESWREAIEKWKDHPLIGQGIPAGIIIDNQYARILREVGIIGFFIFSWLIAMIFKAAWQVYKSRYDDDFVCGFSLGYICALVGLLTQAFTAETFIIVRIMEPFWFLTAIIVILPQRCLSLKETS
ncbi:MAG: O-antigen ligase family protein [Candidatus Omnitrophica bacterium]|nr:O-antigen ligase family protein [Candidatus Omnitrophota bacterium]